MGGSLYQADISFTLPDAKAMGKTDHEYRQLGKKIYKALENTWNWDDWGSWPDEKKGVVHFSATGEDTTRDEGAIVHEAAAEIWKVVGQFVEVEVSTCCLENLPCEGWTADEDDYEEWMKTNLLDVMANEGKSDG